MVGAQVLRLCRFLPGDRSRRRLGSGIRADPSGQHQGGALDLPLGLQLLVLQHRQRRASAEEIGLAAAAAFKGDLGPLNLQPRLLRLLAQQFELRQRVMALDPGQRGFAPHGGDGQLPFGKHPLRITLQPLHLELAFLGAGHFLHHADPAHGHEIPCEAQAIRTVERQVVDAEFQHRVGQATGRCLQLPQAFGGCVLGDQLLGARQRDALCLRKGQSRLGPAGEREQ